MNNLFLIQIMRPKQFSPSNLKLIQQLCPAQAIVSLSFFLHTLYTASIWRVARLFGNGFIIFIDIII
jgi:heme/copper-type cytochrome/quinol oxidase subunit 4